LSAASVWITGRHRAGEAVRVADRDHELPDPERGGVAERRRGRRGLVGAQHGEVGERIGADHAQRQLAPVGERGAHAPAATALDDMRRGEQEAVGSDHDAGAGADGAAAPGQPQVRHRGGHRLRHGGHHARVGVERLGLVGEGHVSHLQNDSDCPRGLEHAG
jgi:hypothetical protein